MFKNGKPSINRLFSMAMLNNQRGTWGEREIYIYIYTHIYIYTYIYIMGCHQQGWRTREYSIIPSYGLKTRSETPNRIRLFTACFFEVACFRQFPVDFSPVQRVKMRQTWRHTTEERLSAERRVLRFVWSSSDHLIAAESQ